MVDEQEALVWIPIFLPSPEKVMFEFSYHLNGDPALVLDLRGVPSLTFVFKIGKQIRIRPKHPDPRYVYVYLQEFPSTLARQQSTTKKNSSPYISPFRSRIADLDPEFQKAQIRIWFLPWSKFSLRSNSVFLPFTQKKLQATHTWNFLITVLFEHQVQ